MKFFIFLFLLNITFVFAGEEAIKSKDLKNKEITSIPIQNDSGETLTPEQIAKFQADIATIKENQKKAAEALEELEKSQ